MQVLVTTGRISVDCDASPRSWDASGTISTIQPESVILDLKLFCSLWRMFGGSGSPGEDDRSYRLLLRDDKARWPQRVIWQPRWEEVEPSWLWHPEGFTLDLQPPGVQIRVRDELQISALMCSFASSSNFLPTGNVSSRNWHENKHPHLVMDLLLPSPPHPRWQSRRWLPHFS